MPMCAAIDAISTIDAELESCGARACNRKNGPLKLVTLCDLEADAGGAAGDEDLLPAETSAIPSHISILWELRDCADSGSDSSF